MRIKFNFGNTECTFEYDGVRIYINSKTYIVLYNNVLFEGTEEVTLLFYDDNSSKVLFDLPVLNTKITKVYFNNFVQSDIEKGLEKINTSDHKFVNGILPHINSLLAIQWVTHNLFEIKN